MANVMIDIETLGLSPNSAILSIAAVPFYPTPYLHEFYSRIDVASCHELGLVSEPGTVKWWMAQEAETRDETFAGNECIVSALHSLVDYLSQFDDLTLWSCGTDFDFPILVNAFNKAGIPVPWKYNSIRDYRTLRQLASNIKPPSPNPTKHNALADATYQAAHCELILKEILKCQRN